MKQDKKYQHLLKTMFIIEVIGEAFYKTLILKVNDDKIRDIFKRLALNEKQTGKVIKNEISRLDNNPNNFLTRIICKAAGFVFSLITAKQLLRLLKLILIRRIYSRWYCLYKHNNQDFWQQLLEHENLQHKFLRPFWNKK